MGVSLGVITLARPQMPAQSAGPLVSNFPCVVHGSLDCSLCFAVLVCLVLATEVLLKCLCLGKWHKHFFVLSLCPAEAVSLGTAAHEQADTRDVCLL